MVLKKIRKIVSAVIALTMAASLCCISASASDLEAGNVIVGRGSEIKANDTSWSRSNKYYKDGDYNSSSGSASDRTQIIAKPQGDVGSSTGFIQAYSGMDVSGFKFVHQRFRFSCTGAFQIRLRRSTSGNQQWMNFDSDGSISPNSAFTEDEELDTEWNVSEDNSHWVENTLDIIRSANGVYLYINGVLASYTYLNDTINGNYRGFLIYTNAGWGTSDGFRWRYDDTLGVDGIGNSYTKYVDTETHSVSFEEVLADKGLTPAYKDSDQFFENDNVFDYVYAKNSATLTYPEDNSVRIQGEYYEGYGYAQNLMNFFRKQNSGDGLGYLRETEVGGSILCMTFALQVTEGNRAEIRLCANNVNQNSNRFTFTPEEGKIRVNGFSNEGVTLNKTWGEDPVNVGIIIDKVNRKAYSIADGILLGDAFDFSSVGDFNDLKVYLSGNSEENKTADVTISNWSLKEYYTSKDRNGLIAELVGIPVYFPEIGNSIEYEDDMFGMSVTANTTIGAEVDSAKIYAVLYDNEGKLIGFESRDYVDGETIDDLVFDLDGVDKVKLFCFKFDPEEEKVTFEGLARSVTYTVEQPVVAEE